MMNPLSRLLDRVLHWGAPEEAEGLPPLRLTADEARALYVAARFTRLHTEGHLSEFTRAACEKLAALLPDSVRAEVDPLAEIAESLHPLRPINLDDPRLITLQRAIRSRRVLWMNYQKYGKDEPLWREIEPYLLSRIDNDWYLSAHDRKSGEKRTFRVDRMDEIMLLDDTFEPRIDADPDRVPFAVRVRFEPDVLMQVRTNQHPTFRHEETPPGDRRRVMVYEVRDFSEVRGWLLGWGAAAEVLEPLECRADLRDEALRLADVLR